MRLPIGAGMPMDSKGPMPPGAEGAFGAGPSAPESYGLTDFHVVWDYHLHTLRYLSPERDVQIFDTEDGPSGDVLARLSEGVLQFVRDNQDFLGADESQLTEPEIHPLGNHWLVLMRQKLDDPGGNPVFVRGANARFLILEDGNLGFVKSFLTRSELDVAPTFCDPTTIQNHLENDLGYTIHSRERQFVFPTSDVASAIPAWSVQITDRDGFPGQLLLHAESCEIMEEGRQVFHFPLSGSLRGISPTTDPADSNYFFTTPEDIDEGKSYPVLHARVQSQDVVTVTDEQGLFEIEVSDGQGAEWVLERFYEEPQGFALACGLTGDGVEPTQRNATVEMPLDSVGFGCQELANGEVTGDTVIRTRDGDPQTAIELSTRLMAFHHASRFLDDFLVKTSTFKLESDGKFPVSIRLPASGGETFYLPGFDRWNIYLAPAIELDDGRVQPMTPSVINHEVAHHALFNLTNARLGWLLDCYFPDAFPIAVSLCNSAFGDQGVVQDSGVSAIEAATDVLAADYSRESRFGFYGDERTAGALSYDISKLPEENQPRLEEQHALLAHVLWSLRREFGGIADGATELGFDRLFYSWIASNRVMDAADHSFVISATVYSELEDLRRALIGCGDPVVEYERAIVDAFLEGGAPLLPIRFKRGDSNQDGIADISDVIHMLRFQFFGDVPVFCDEALDVDDTDSIDVTDPILLLVHLFLGGAPPAPPYTECGFDNTGAVQDGLECLGLGRGGCEVRVPCNEPL